MRVGLVAFPGSGKTTVALHRVAYLAFDDPALDGPETLVVVFSRALQRFVEPLYSGTAQSIIDTLPALVNS